MQKDQFPIKQNIWLLMLVITVFSLAIISSCKDKEKKKEVIEKGLVGCPVTLPATAIQDKWVANNFTKPGDKNLIYTIDILANYNPLTKEFMVYVQGVRKDHTIVTNSEIKVFEGTACTPPSFTLISPHNYFDLADLDILEKDGKLKNFNSIRFTPQKYSDDNRIMSFAIAIVPPGSGPEVDRGEGLPCPPCVNCKPPCPADCTPPCSKEDSAKLRDPLYNVVNDSLPTK